MFTSIVDTDASVFVLATEGINNPACGDTEKLVTSPQGPDKLQLRCTCSKCSSEPKIVRTDNVIISHANAHSYSPITSIEIIKVGWNHWTC